MAVLILPFDLVTWCQIAVSVLPVYCKGKNLKQYELVVVSFVVGRHFEREEAGQEGDNVDSQQVLSSAPLLLPLRTFGRLGWGRCSEGSFTYYIINQGEKNFANGEKRFQIRNG